MGRSRKDFLSAISLEFWKKPEETPKSVYPPVDPSIRARFWQEIVRGPASSVRPSGIVTLLVSMKKQTASTTLRDYKSSTYYHLIPAFGDLPVDKLTAQAIRTWTPASKIFSYKRINNNLVPLRGGIGDSVYDGVTDKNPLDQIKNLPLETREPDPFTPEEVGLILQTAEGTFRNLIQFAFWTGLRTSELISSNGGTLTGRGDRCS